MSSFTSSRGNAPEHFQSLSDRGIGNVVYANYEAIPEAIDVEDYFRVVTLFKRNFRHVSKLVSKPATNKSCKNVFSQLRERLFFSAIPTANPLL